MPPRSCSRDCSSSSFSCACSMMSSVCGVTDLSFVLTAVPAVPLAGRPLGRGAAAFAGLQHDLYAVLLFVLEDLIGPRRLIEREPMRDDEARIDLALLNALQQRSQIAMHVRLPGNQRQRLVHEGSHRH